MSDAINLIMIGKASGSVFYIVYGVALLVVTSLASFAARAYWSKRKLKRKTDVEKQEINSKANELMSAMADAIKIDITKTSPSSDVVQERV